MKTKCKCNICGFELSGNSKFDVERAMWNHIKDKHPTEVLKFDDKRKAIRKKINELQKKIPSLYSTEWKGTIRRGSWTY